MLNSEERELRKSQVGASEVYKLFNFDSQTLQSLFLQKIGIEEVPELDNEAIRAGNILEEDCIMFYLEKNNIKAYVLNKRFEHSTIKNFVASTDGFSIIPIEIKTVGMEKFIKVCSENKPDKNHYIQCQAQMSCSGTDSSVIVYFGLTNYDRQFPLEYVPNEFTMHPIGIWRDDELIQEMEERVKYFLWCVQYHWTPSEKDYLLRRLEL